MGMVIKDFRYMYLIYFPLDFYNTKLISKSCALWLLNVFMDL